jgi:hypothetical protein
MSQDVGIRSMLRRAQSRTFARALAFAAVTAGSCTVVGVSGGVVVTATA